MRQRFYRAERRSCYRAGSRNTIQRFTRLFCAVRLRRGILISERRQLAARMFILIFWWSFAWLFACVAKTSYCIFIDHRVDVTGPTWVPSPGAVPIYTAYCHVFSQDMAGLRCCHVSVPYVWHCSRSLQQSFAMQPGNARSMARRCLLQVSQHVSPSCS